MQDIYSEVCNMRREGKEGVLITVVDRKGQGPSVIGKKLLLFSDGRKLGTIGGGELEFLALSKAREMMREKKSGIQAYDFTGRNINKDAISINMICGGLVTLYFEFFGISPSAFVFGLGHVGRSVAGLLDGLDFKTVLIDDREEYLKNLPEGQEYLRGDYAEIIANLEIPDDSYIVVAAYSHEIEYKVLKALYQRKISPRYIGLLASRNKANHMVRRLREEVGKDIDFKNFYGPIGLEIGGDSPQEIAISIVSEILALKHGKVGNMHKTAQWSEA